MWFVGSRHCLCFLQVQIDVRCRSSKSAAEQVKWAVLDGMVLQLYNAEYVCECGARGELK